MKTLIFLSTLASIFLLNACKKSRTDIIANACTTNNTCTVTFTNDYTTAADINVYDAGNAVKLTVTGLAAGTSVTKDVPASGVKIIWSGSTSVTHTVTYTACQTFTENFNVPVNPAKGVYVAGWENNGTVNVAKYWKDGTAVSLTNGTKDAWSNSVWVAGTDVYSCGYENNGTKNVAKIWKNTTATLLTDGTKDAFAASVTVSGTDVYAVGWETQPAGNDVSKIWKNGVAISLSGTTNNSRAFSVKVFGSDVYVAGYENNTGSAGIRAVAKYWKNGVSVPLTDGSRVAYGADITVVGTDVYVSGSEGNGTVQIAKYWKNGVVVPATVTSSTIRSFLCGIAVIGTDVVMAGSDNGTPASWKNNVKTNFVNAGDLSWLYVVGTDVYLAGYEGNGVLDKATVWKNGVATSLTNGTKDAIANGVFVVP